MNGGTLGRCDCHEGVHTFRNDPDPCIGWRDEVGTSDEPMSLEVRALHRAKMRVCIERIAAETSSLLAYWQNSNLPGDFLNGDEYPFTEALEEVTSSCHHAVDVMRTREDVDTSDALAIAVDLLEGGAGPEYARAILDFLTAEHDGVDRGYIAKLLDVTESTPVDLTKRPAAPREVPWLTLGEFRRLTADLPDDAPITAYGVEGATPSDWLNVDLTAEAVDNFTSGDQPSVILDLHDTFDTRQW